MTNPVGDLRNLLSFITPGHAQPAFHGTYEVEKPPGVLFADMGNVLGSEVNAKAVAKLLACLPEVLDLVEACEAIVCHYDDCDLGPMGCDSCRIQIPFEALESKLEDLDT